jgi:D-proline reductase (dithiol) PrdB
MSTIVLSSIPDLTASVSVPRLAAIEYPLGYLFGLPGDKERQRAVLQAVLNALVEMRNPGSIVHIPFSWLASASVLELEPPEAPPIVKYLLRHPWHIKNFYTREVPSRYKSNKRKGKS